MDSYLDEEGEPVGVWWLKRVTTLAEKVPRWPSRKTEGSPSNDRAPLCSPPPATANRLQRRSASILPGWNIGTNRFSPPTSSPSSSYLINSLLSSPNTRAAFVCNWMDAHLGERSCGKRFSDHLHFLEHLYTVHTGIGRWPHSSLQWRLSFWKSNKRTSQQTCNDWASS